jgi:hypothetical protein
LFWVVPPPHIFSLWSPSPLPQNEQRQHMTRYKSTNTLRMISGQQSVLSARITPAEVGGATRVNNKTNQIHINIRKRNSVFLL